VITATRILMPRNATTRNRNRRRSRATRVASARASGSRFQGTGAPRVSTGLTTAGAFSIVGMPDRMLVSLKYTDNYVFTGSANPNPQVWRLNSLFKPDFTGAGHQPTFFDQWTALYNQYLVVGTKIDLQIVSASSVPVLWSLASADIQQSSLGIDAMSEMKLSRRGVLGPLTGNGVARTSLKVSIPSATGETLEEVMGDPSGYANTGLSPTDVVYAWFRCAAYDSSTSITVSILTTLTFECVFRSVNAPGTS